MKISENKMNLPYKLKFVDRKFSIYLITKMLKKYRSIFLENYTKE